MLGNRRSAAPTRLTAAMAACGLALLMSGCSHASSVQPTRQVLLTSGTSQGVWWGVWAWEGGAGHLCMAMAGRDGPNAAHPPPQDAAGGACGFARTPSYPHFVDSGRGPAGSGFSMGPLPPDATQIRVAAKEILPTEPLPRGVGLPPGRYWVEIVPAAGRPSADGRVLDTPQPLNAAAQPVAFKKF